MKKISIIIPMYNAEKTISKCVESVFNQSYRNIEIILINDGSTDKTASICKSLIVQYSPKIKYVEQKNTGVSGARNMGIKLATGTWLQFVDADDTVKPEYSSLMAQNMSSYDWKIAGYATMKNGQTEEYTPNKKEYSKKEFLNNIYMFIQPQNFLYSSVNKIYKKEIIDEYSIRFFTDHIMGEDALFNLSYLKYCNVIMTVEESEYIYIKDNDLSATNNIDTSWFFTNYEIATEIRSQLLELGIDYTKAKGYKFYKNKMTELYFTRLMLLKRTGSRLVYRKKIFELLKEYKRWEIEPQGKQRWVFELLLKSIEKRQFNKAFYIILIAKKYGEWKRR